MKKVITTTRADGWREHKIITTKEMNDIFKLGIKIRRKIKNYERI